MTGFGAVPTRPASAAALALVCATGVATAAAAADLPILSGPCIDGASWQAYPGFAMHGPCGPGREGVAYFECDHKLRWRLNLMMGTPSLQVGELRALYVTIDGRTLAIRGEGVADHLEGGPVFVADVTDLSLMDALARGASATFNTTPDPWTVSLAGTADVFAAAARTCLEGAN